MKRDNKKIWHGTAYNTVFVERYASPNPPSTDFTNTEDVK